MSRRNNLILGVIVIFAFSWVKSIWALVYIFLLLATLEGGAIYGSLCAGTAFLGAGLSSLVIYGGLSVDLISHLFLLMITVGLGHFVSLRAEERRVGKECRSRLSPTP